MYHAWTRGNINGGRYWDGNQWTGGLGYLTLQSFYIPFSFMGFTDIICSTFICLI